MTNREKRLALADRLRSGIALLAAMLLLSPTGGKVFFRLLYP